jgi:hypothetical protein
MPEIVQQANLSEAAYRTSHEVGGDCGNLATLCPRLRPQLLVRRMRRQVLLPDQDTLPLGHPAEIPGLPVNGVLRRC